LEDDHARIHAWLMFAFWAFDKKPPKFISSAKPVAGLNKNGEVSTCKKQKTIIS
jgi:hypothetical protein